MKRKKNIIIESDAACLARRGAEIFSRSATESVNLRGFFTVAISGGSTPRRMHRLLAEEPFCSDIPWDKTEIFWVDERCVPNNNPASNYGAAKKDLLDVIPIPKMQVHPMPGECASEDGALEYEQELIDFFHPGAGNVPIFDLVFLGIGTDGHTASLFPAQVALYERERLVVAVKGGKPDLSRLTMTFPILNSGRHLVFMVSGKEKAGVVKIALEQFQAGLPAQRIHPFNGTLSWLLDSEAASLLEGGTAHEES